MYVNNKVIYKRQKNWSRWNTWNTWLMFERMIINED